MLAISAQRFPASAFGVSGDMSSGTQGGARSVSVSAVRESATIIS
jgi:hypothetical protein